jgi:hypothetical protein
LKREQKNERQICERTANDIHRSNFNSLFSKRQNRQYGRKQRLNLQNQQTNRKHHGMSF